MRRAIARLSRVVAGVGLLGLVVAGCGVPGSSRPIDRGSAPPINGDKSATQLTTPQGPDGATSPLDVVQRYLQAAAWSNSKGGDRPKAADEAEQLVRKFLTDEAAATWSAGNKELNLVRVVLGNTKAAGDGSVTIDATLEPVGVLDDVGSVKKPTATAPLRFTFSVVTIDGGRQRRLAGAPPGLFLDVSTITGWYEVRTVYFWSSDSGAVLVPDRRYMPKAVSTDKQPDEVWRWLTTGPSDLLASSVQTLPHTVNLKDHVVVDRQGGSSVLVLNLTSEAASLSPTPSLKNLVTQFRWSMLPGTTPVELRIEGVKKDVDGSSDDYLRYNPAVWPAKQTEPEELFVYGGKARVVNTSTEATPSVLFASANEGVMSAALATSAGGERQWAALVRQEADGQRLWLGRLSIQNQLRTPEYVRTEVSGASLSRPTWLSGANPRVLLAVDGQLTAVTMEGRAIALDGLAGLPAGVTAVAAAPDGLRLALIVGGQAGIAPLRVEGDSLSVRGFYPLSTGLAEPKGIGWSQEDLLLVGGRATSGSPLVKISVDGTIRELVDRTGLTSLVITRLVAYPNDPSASGDRLLAMFEAGGEAYNVYGQQVDHLSPIDSVQIPSTTGHSSPPTAPFFLEVV